MHHTFFARTRPFHRSTYKRPVMTVSVTSEQWWYNREPPVARALEALVTSRSRHHPLSVAGHTHSHARTLTCFAFFPTVFEEKRGRSQSTQHHKALLISNPIEKKPCKLAWHAWGHTGMCFNTENSFLSSFFSYVNLFSAYNSANSPFKLMVSLLHLH